MTLLLLSLLSGCFAPSENDGGEDFVFTTLDGTTKHLSDYRGKVIILDMWAIWCGPCQFQMLELRKVYENYSRDDLEILSINIDLYETSQQIKIFKEEFKEYGYELSWVFGKDDGSIWEEFQLAGGGIPTIYIFDKKGNIYYSNEGCEQYSVLAEKLDELLK